MDGWTQLELGDFAVVTVTSRYCDNVSEYSPAVLACDHTWTKYFLFASTSNVCSRLPPGVRTSGPKPVDRISELNVLSAGSSVAERLRTLTLILPALGDSNE